MKMRTSIFELYKGKYTNLTELAQVMGISISQIYRVRRAERPITEKFIIGAIRAFPGSKLDDLFRVVPQGSENDSN